MDSLPDDEFRTLLQQGLLSDLLGRVDLERTPTESPKRRALNAQLLFKIGQIKESRDVYSSLVNEFGDWNARLNLGHCEKALGNHQLAATHYRGLIQGDNSSRRAIAFWSLANMKDRLLDQEDRLALLDILEDEELSLAGRALANFTLAALEEESGDLGAAFGYLTEANDLIAMNRPWRGDAYQQLIHRLMQFAGEARHRAETNVVRPVFIVGMPRSGTTLVEQILASHSKVEATDELLYLDQVSRALEETVGGYAKRIKKLTFEEISRWQHFYAESSALHCSNTKPVRIDKNPNNFLHVALIMALFPHAKIVNLVRPSLDNAMSVYSQFFPLGHEYSYTLKGIVFYWQGYVTLMKHWKSLFSDSMINVSYANLVSDSKSEITKLLDFCELTHEPLCFEPNRSDRVVLTPSAAQVRKPIEASGLGKGMRYAEFMPDHVDAFRRIDQVVSEVLV
jgi:tetratricopeptide (TPR) repeat protein